MLPSSRLTLLGFATTASYRGHPDVPGFEARLTLLGFATTASRAMHSKIDEMDRLTLLGFATTASSSFAVMLSPAKAPRLTLLGFATTASTQSPLRRPLRTPPHASWIRDDCVNNGRE